MESVKEITGIDHSIKFKTPTACLIAGPSQSGKSFFVKRLLLERDRLFDHPPAAIIYVYENWSENLSDLQTKIPEIHFQKTLPTRKDFDKFSQDKLSRFVIIDDKLHALKEASDIVYIMTVGIHAGNVSVFFTTQSLFYQHAKCYRELSLNTHVFILMRSKRMASQINELARQIFPTKKKYFIDSYEKATSKNFAYLVADLAATADEAYQLRTQIFENENCIVFTEI